ncbi:MAG: alpha/beta hydrolase [Immundisolibacterales bacterium]|nr:alpha/beta hydrolase [Immundisolibacterales bacterium]
MLQHGIEGIRAHLATLPNMRDQTVEEAREMYDKAKYVFALPEGVETAQHEIGGVPAEVVTPPARGAGTFLYLHGGGYAIGSPVSHRHLVAALAVASRTRAVALDYRLAPENPFPAALDDALAGYRGLLDAGTAPGSIVIGGDSAGGGLTVATLLAIRDAGLPLPAAAVCISPWADLTNEAESYRTHAERDPLVFQEDIDRWGGAYLAGADPRTPLASPLHADLSGLPPLLIQVGSEEVLLDDSRLLAQRCKAAGGDATLEVWDDMIHVWHWFGEYLDEAAKAVDRIGEFVRDRLTG